MTGGHGIGSDRCWLVERHPDGRVTGGPRPLPDDVRAAAAGDGPLVRVDAAGFNYKDALACAGHPGVARMLPLIPGIDAAGTLLEATDGLPEGADVVVTGNGLGETRHGGFATLLRAPATAIVPRPPALSAHAAMALGTAGLTVLLAVDRIAQVIPRGHGQPADAEWLVTGAGGGVGMLAVATLAAAGRRVVACSRKSTVAATLRAFGASEVVVPDALRAAAGKPLLRGRWAGVIDTVGGAILADALKAVLPGGVVAAIGMAGGVELPTTVHPFILRGVTLCGIDAASLPTQAERAALWPRLADLWPRVRDVLPVTTLALDDVGDWAAAMIAGESVGRAVVEPAAARPPRHTINLSSAWEPDASGTTWRRRFGRPSGVGPGDAVWLVVAAPGTASVAVNGTPLAALRRGPTPWRQDVTRLLDERNEIVLACAAPVAPTDRDASGRATLPAALGRPALEVIPEAVDS